MSRVGVPTVRLVLHVVAAAALVLGLGGCSAPRGADRETAATPSSPEASRPASTDAPANPGTVSASPHETEGGNASAAEVDFAAFGLPAYPGARTAPRMGTMRMGAGSRSMTFAAFITDDTPEAVADWLANHLKVEQSSATAQGGMVAGRNERGERVVVTLQRKPSDTVTTVMLRVQPS